MKAVTAPVSACRYCQHYQPIGRRGGTCQMLGVSVQGVWKGCNLGVMPFASEGESYENYQINRELVRPA